MTKVGLCAIGKSTTLESNKSPTGYRDTTVSVMHTFSHGSGTPPVH